MGRRREGKKRGEKAQKYGNVRMSEISETCLWWGRRPQA